VAFWLICFAYFGISLIQRGKRNYVVYMAASLGLAFLTKGTAYVLWIPLFIYFFTWVWVRYRSHWLKYVCMTLIVIFVINSGHLIRNFSLFGNPFFAEKGEPNHFRMEVVGLPFLLSNVVRNLSLHMDVVSNLHLQGAFPEFHDKLENGIKSFHEKIGVDVSDPRTTWTAGGLKYYIPSVTPDPKHLEPLLGNAFHLLLILLTLLIFPFRRRDKFGVETATFALSLVLTFLLFCLLVKWEPWHSRHHLMIFALWAPLVSLILIDRMPRWGSTLIGSFLILLCFPQILDNKTRPLLGKDSIFVTKRSTQYFSQVPYLNIPFHSTADYLHSRNCREIGLFFEDPHVTMDFFIEYPLWALLKDKFGNNFQIRQVMVDNASSRRAFVSPTFTPCAVVGLYYDMAGERRVEVDGNVYPLSKRFGVAHIYMAKKPRK